MKRILIADDHALIRDGVRAQLSTLEGGVRVLEARDWKETFAAAADPTLDLALIDLSMPGRDGLEALGELVHQYPGLPVLVVSASKSREHMKRARARGRWGTCPRPSRRG